MATDIKSETMAITDPGNPCNIGEIGTSLRNGGSPFLFDMSTPVTSGELLSHFLPQESDAIAVVVALEESANSLSAGREQDFVRLALFDNDAAINEDDAVSDIARTCRSTGRRRRTISAMRS